jgi:hypothetical protein
MSKIRTEYWWITIDESNEPVIAQIYFSGALSGVAYPCGDEQGWPADRYELVQRIRQLRPARTNAPAMP